MKIGVDVGGTFTDLVLVDRESQGARFVKVLSDREATKGIMNAIELSGASLGEVSTFVFGSTIAINALIERRYPTIGLLTNVGFRDVLEIGRIWREHLFGSFWEKPKPLVPRELRAEVPGRLDSEGVETEPIDLEAVRKSVNVLVKQGAETLAVCFLHSHINGAHERKVKDFIEAEYPKLSVSISSEESPLRGEYERFNTTVVSAALKPVIQSELERMEEQLRRGGYENDIFVMKSNGGVMSISAAKRKPHELIQSGPAGGATAARRLATEMLIQNVITLDIGGTTADVSLMIDGEPTMARRLFLDWDLPVDVSLIDINSVGAGGGSIATIDAAGHVRVGPRSAGSLPGPVALNRGGTEITLTDAAISSGALDTDRFAGGSIPMDRSLADRRIDEIGFPEALGVDSVQDSAAGILELAAVSIAQQIRALTIKHGIDPREFTLLVYGGAGGLFAADIARHLDITRIISPNFSSVFSAWGALFGEEEHHYARTVNNREGVSLLSELEMHFDSMISDANKDFTALNFESTAELDMQYAGQSHVLPITVPLRLDSKAISEAQTHFESEHGAQFGHTRPEDPVIVAGARLHARRTIMEISPRVLQGGEVSSDTYSARRLVHRYGFEPQEWSSIKREEIDRSSRIEGPAIVEDGNSTIVIPNGWRCSLGTLGELLLTATTT